MSAASQSQNQCLLEDVTADVSQRCEPPTIVQTKCLSVSLAGHHTRVLLASM